MQGKVRHEQSDGVSTLLLFTYADEGYYKFVIPYIYFALRNNPNAVVEICVEDHEKFRAVNKSAEERLHNIYPGRFLIRESSLGKTQNIIPNTVRFIENPVMRAEYLYIGDIDILVFDDVLATHTGLMKRYGIPFSNVVRQDSINSGRLRLTGLHFCLYKDYYPVPDCSDINFTKDNDEHVLYRIMAKKGMMVPNEFQIRPECGIHMSTNRDPAGRHAHGPAYANTKSLRWGGERYYPKFLEQCKEPGFLSLYMLLDIEFRQLLLILESIVTDKLRALHRMACKFIIDKRLLVPFERSLLINLSIARRKSAASGQVKRFKQFSSVLLLMWPYNVQVLEVEPS